MLEKFFKHPKLIVAVIAVITIFFALQLPKAQLDNNNFRFVPENNQSRLDLKKIDKKFGSQVFIMVGLERKMGSILEADFLKTLQSYVTALQENPLIESVTSIANVDYITGSADSIIIEPLIPDSFTGTADELAVLRDKLLSWDLYRRALFSEDFSSTQILVSLNATTDEADSKVVSETYYVVKKLAEQAGFKGTKIYYAGMPVVSEEVNIAMRSDLVILIPLVVLVVLGVLFFSFRKVAGVILPMLTVIVSCIWSIGAMSLFGVKLSIVSTVLPVILVAVGSAYGIHVVSHYYDELALHQRLSAEEHRQIIFAVLRRIGQPVLLAALTTFAGFVSFCFTQVVPLYEFGIFSSFGVLVAFITALTLIPSLLILRGPPKSKNLATHAPQETKPDKLSEALANGLMRIAQKKKTVSLAVILVLMFSFLGLSRLVIDNVLVEYFKEDTDVAQSDKFIRKHFGGTKTVSIVVSGKEKGDVLDPAVLNAMDGLASYLKRSVPEVGKVTGFTDFIKRMNQVFNADASPDGLMQVQESNWQPVGNDGGSAGFGLGSDSGFGLGLGFLDEEESAPNAPVQNEVQPLDMLKMAEILSKAIAQSPKANMTAEELVAEIRKVTNYQGAAYYEIPHDPQRYGKQNEAELKAFIYDYLVLLAGNISSYADDPLEPLSIRMDVQFRTLGQHDTNRAIEAIHAYTDEYFPKTVSVFVGGTALVEDALNHLIVQSQLQSIVFSLVMVFIILAVYYKSFAAGLLGILSLSISILINFGVMGLFGIKLNIGTSMVASIAVGTGIDYIIHYLAAYKREYAKADDPENFLRRTFSSSGKAILFNAVSVGAGFAVLGFSQFNILAYLGILIAIAMATSATVSLTVLPLLLRVFKPKFIQKT